jgi:hypothetical protein
MENRLKDLEQRLAHAEVAIERLSAELAVRKEQGTTVTTPFRVVNAQGRVLLEINTWRPDTSSEANSIRIFNREGTVTAQIGTQAEGGFLAIRDDAGKLIAYLTTETAGAKLELLSSHNEGGLVLGTDDDGGWMNILHASKAGINIGIGLEAQEGTLNISSNETGDAIITIAKTAPGDQLKITAGGKIYTFPVNQSAE